MTVVFDLDGVLSTRDTFTALLAERARVHGASARLIAIALRARDRP